MGFPSYPRKSLHNSVWNPNFQCKAQTINYIFKENSSFHFEVATWAVQPRRMETHQGWSCSASLKISSLRCRHENVAPNFILCFSPQKSYASPRAPLSLPRLYTRVILPEKRNFIKLGEKRNCLKIGFGRAPAPRSVCEAFRGFRKLRVLPQVISN